ncbi:MAG: amidohydrolase [Planctomycetota bacterium]
MTALDPFHAMRTFVVACVMAMPACLATGQSSGAARQTQDADIKSALASSVQQLDDAMWSAAMDIWRFAEPGYQENNSSRRLSAFLSDHGFRIESPIAGMPTAFRASYGDGKPVIALLGEFDALPGLSQDDKPVQSPRSDSNYGHGCGHHLFGVASAAAAISIAQQIRAGTIEGTIRLYGCPAEEGGAAKAFMARDGYFDDCDVALHWHPDDENVAGNRGAIARIAAKFKFHGRSAHAASSPEQGRSALDAVELTNHAVQLMREHVPDATRIHHVITAGGSAPNVVPDFAEVYYYIRHPDSRTLRGLYERLVKCAKAGALATETRLEIENQGGTVEMLPNTVLSEIGTRNLIEQNDLAIRPDEMPFVARLQQSLGEAIPLETLGTVKQINGSKGRGSTDVSDVSWVTPTTGFAVACWVPGTPGHSWQAVACGAQPLARRGMNVAARALAATSYDLFVSPELIQAARNELNSRLGDRKYQPLIGADQPPPLEYRNNAPRGDYRP